MRKHKKSSIKCDRKCAWKIRVLLFIFKNSCALNSGNLSRYLYSFNITVFILCFWNDNVCIHCFLQYRVESMMLRVAKPMNYIPVTPSIQQRAQMKAPQCVPLIMEPESRFYSNAVLVLDFQSLYPSIVIAYNYCFSTCLGPVENLGK